MSLRVLFDRYVGVATLGRTHSGRVAKSDCSRAQPVEQCKDHLMLDTAGICVILE